MATLNWIGKESIVDHDQEVPFKLLKKIPSASVGKESKNLIIHGDNLEALKALMPFYKSKVKCVYIDPPYNTGNEGWIYNDKVNSPKIREWLGETVGAEAQDLTRHDKWLCMMYPRLKLLRNLLSDDGVMFISIDDNEQHNLRLIMDEIMPGSFVTTIHVQMSTVQGQKVRSAKQGNIVKNAEYVLVYSKNKKKNIGQKPLYDIAGYDSHYSLFLEKAEAGYKIRNLGEVVLREKEVVKQLKELGIIKDLNSPKLAGGNLAEAYSTSSLFKDFIHKNASNIARYHDTAEVDEENLDIKINITDDHAIKYSSKTRNYLITKDTKGAYKQLITLEEKIRVADDFNKTLGVTTIRGDWWPGFYLDMGNVSKEGDTDYKNGKKPIRLIKQLIKFSTKEDDLILDSFAGSGSTGHAVMDLNAEDKTNRNFILIEMEDHVAEQVTAGRIKESIKNL
jgi:adenine-specific DNA-methyltransferase